MIAPVTVLAQINSHSVRSMASLDKKVSFSAEVVEEDDLKLRFAQWLLYMPCETVFKITIEPVED